MDLNDLASFVRVADLGTITAAAEAEGVPKSTISRRIARLEGQLGVALLRRGARAVALTEDGQIVHARARGALSELGDVERALDEMRGVPRGRLVLTAPHDLGRLARVAELLVEYRDRYPEVTLDLRLEERVVDLVREGVDVGLRAHQGEIPGDGTLMARRLGGPSSGLFASRRYLDRRGVPGSVEDLAGHDFVAHVATLSRSISLVHDGGDRVELELRSLPIVAEVNDFGMVHALAAAGLGIALLPTLDLGGLVPVLPRWSGRAGQLSLVWQASRYQSPRVRAFVDLATERLSRPG